MKWERKPLEHIVDFYNGKSIKPSMIGSFPAYGSNGLIGFSEKYLYDKGIIIGRVGANCGSVKISLDNFWPSDNTIVAKPKNNADIMFVYYLLNNHPLNNYAGGAAQPLLTQTVLKPIEFNIPDSTTQRRIASILSAYDDLIENNLKRIKLLEEKAVLEYKCLNRELQDLNSGKKKLKDILDLKYGKALKSDNRIDGKYPVYGSSGVIGSHESYLVTGPGIIVGRKGNVGSVFWAFDNFWVIDTAYFVESEISLYYLYFNLKEQHFENTDAAVPGLNRNFALDNPIFLPQNKKIILFEESVKPTFHLMQNLLQQNTLLRQARDILLPRLMSGEIEI